MRQFRGPRQGWQSEKIFDPCGGCGTHSESRGQDCRDQFSTLCRALPQRCPCLVSEQPNESILTIRHCCQQNMSGNPAYSFKRIAQWQALFLLTLYTWINIIPIESR